MAKTRIGLDIGATAVRAAEVSVNGSAALVRAAQVPLEPKAVENGEIRNPEAVAEAVRELWHAGHFKSRQVHMGVANQRVVVREVALPWLPAKELQESIVTNLQKVRIDEEDETEELASLSDAAEALRLTAAAPPRPTPSGGDYE